MPESTSSRPVVKVITLPKSAEPKTAPAPDAEKPAAAPVAAPDATAAAAKPAEPAKPAPAAEAKPAAPPAGMTEAAKALISAPVASATASEPAKPDAPVSQKATDDDARFAALAERERAVREAERRNRDRFERERAEFERERSAWRAEREKANAPAPKPPRPPPTTPDEARKYEMDDLRELAEQAERRSAELEKRLADDRARAEKTAEDQRAQARQAAIGNFTRYVAGYLESSGDKFKHAAALGRAADVVAKVQSELDDYERDYGREEASRYATEANIKALVDKYSEIAENESRDRIRKLYPTAFTSPKTEPAQPPPPAKGEVSTQAEPAPAAAKEPDTEKPAEVAQKPRTIDKSLTARTGAPSNRPQRRSMEERRAAAIAAAEAARRK